MNSRQPKINHHKPTKTNKNNKKEKKIKIKNKEEIKENE